MAGETELERMVVRLLGDSLEYQRMMKDAEEQAKQAADAVKLQAARVEGIGKSLTDYASAAAKSISTMGGAITATVTSAWLQVSDKLSEWGSYSWSWIDRGIDKFIQLEGSQLRLNAAINASGREAAVVVPQYEKFAKALVGVTTVGKLSVMNMLQQAESMGLQDDAAKRAVKNAVALAAAKGGEAESHLHATAALERGHVGRLAHTLGLMGERDESVKLAKAQDMLAGMFDVAKAEGESLGGQIKRLTRDYAALKSQFYDVIGEAAKPVVELLRWVLGFFGHLPKTVKVGVLAILGMTAAFVTLGAAVAAVGATLNLLFGGLGIIVGVIVTAYAAFAGSYVGLAATVAYSVGLFGKLKDAAIAAWEWIKPVRQAVGSLFSTVKELGEGAFLLLKQAARDAWEAISFSSGVNWEEVRSNIVDAILFAEFTLRNFEQVAEFVWAAAKFGFISFANSVMFFFTNQMPALATFFGANWERIIATAYSYTRAAFLNLSMNVESVLMQLIPWVQDAFAQIALGVYSTFERLFDNIARVASALPQLIKGTVKFDDVWKPMGDAFRIQLKELNLKDTWKPLLDGAQNFIGKLPELPKEQEGPLEAAWRAEFEQLRDKLGGDFAAFRAKKLAEWAKDGKDAGDALDVGLTQPVAKAAKEMHKFDQALFGSAEALSRIQEYKNRLGSVPAAAARVAAPPVGPAAQQPQQGAPAPRAPEKQVADDRVINLLTLLLEAARSIAAKGAVEVAEADVG